MPDNVLRLTGQSNNFLAGRHLDFPDGYFIDESGAKWRIVNPKAGHNEVLMEGLDGSIAKIINIINDNFETFVPLSVEVGPSLLKERFRR